MEILEFHAIITKIIEIHCIPRENHESNENHKISYENHENYENYRILYENINNMKIVELH